MESFYEIYKKLNQNEEGEKINENKDNINHINNSKVDISNVINVIENEMISNNILKDEKNEKNYISKIETLEVDIIFRRKFGKKLCFVKGLKNDKSHIEIKIHNFDIIREVKIGDKVDIKGYYDFDEIRKKFIFYCIELKIKIKCPKDFNIFESRLNSSLSDQINEKALCKFFRKNQPCKNEKCFFRHHILENEEEKLFKQKENQKKMYQESHEGDTIHDKDKKSKSKRNKLFAEFLISKYGLDFLKSGPILDVAGGKGMI